MAVGAMGQDNDEPDIQSSLPAAVLLRSGYLKGQADTLTLPAVRRLLEKDLGLKTLQLDAYKPLIKSLVDKVLNEAEDETVVTEKPRKRRKNNKRVIEDGQVDEPGKETASDESNEKKRKLSQDGYSVQDDGGKMEEETPDKQGDVQPELDNERSKETVAEAVDDKPMEPSESHSLVGSVDEDSIKAALLKRADELKSQAESLTVTHVRRLLEQDLGLEPNGLDVHKSYIRGLVDELIEAGKAMEKDRSSGDGRTKKSAVGKIQANKKKVHDDDHEEYGEKPQGDGEISNSESEERRHQKIIKKKNVEAKKKSLEVKKPPEVKRPFSSNVERLRKIIKSIGLGIPPVIYKKAKQASEEDRDNVLVKELENILSREGLPSHPSEKEIRVVKARLTKKRDLEGIDSTNIVAESRRSRTAANSWFTPRPSKLSQVTALSDKDVGTQDSDDDAKPKVTGPMDD